MHVCSYIANYIPYKLISLVKQFFGQIVLVLLESKFAEGYLLLGHLHGSSPVLAWPSTLAG